MKNKSSVRTNVFMFIYTNNITEIERDLPFPTNKKHLKWIYT